MAASSTGLKAMPAPSPSRTMLGKTSIRKVPSTGARAKQQEPDRREAQARRQRRPDPEAHHELGRQPDRESPMIRLAGQEGETDLQRAVAEHELDVERGEEEPREHGRGPEHADDVRGRDVAQPEQPQRHERVADPRLDREEEPEQRHGSAQQRRSSRSRSTPARCRSRSRRRRASGTRSPSPRRRCRGAPRPPGLVPPAAGPGKAQRPRRRSGG